VAAQLAGKGLSMNPEADRRTLARRLALDLTGLPPTPAQVEAFVNDPSPDYYLKFVNELMSAKQWGEHRGRYWLDAARYADTHGLHFDNYREMWPYRDWVINAYNVNRPFDQFIIEQIAGDLLENPTQDQLVATGFQRCNITTNEGGTIEAENLALYANDRVTTTGWVFILSRSQVRSDDAEGFLRARGVLPEHHADRLRQELGRRRPLHGDAAERTGSRPLETTARRDQGRRGDDDAARDVRGKRIRRLEIEVCRAEGGRDPRSRAGVRR
jgi:hypothetical protein